MNIILIGFMGSGKTTIGKALAQRIDFNFLDTDELMEKQQNKTINEIFSSEGEAYFRQLENRAIEELGEIDYSVIAVGGGAVMYYNNFELLKKIGIIVLLDTPLQKILSNLKGKFRPLVGNVIDESKLRELLEYRYSTYKKADLIIDTENLDIMQTVDKIIESISKS